MAWTPAHSESLYNVPNWSGGYFGINQAGNVVARPNGRGEKGGGDERPSEIDIHDLIGQLRRRGIEMPVLLRFDDILRSRVRDLAEAFQRARTEYDYEAPYSPVFPIKVNQQRHLVEVLLDEGTNHGMGVEVGSKPELLAVMALYSEKDRLIICNGYKDRDYVETALLTRRLGAIPVLVIEKSSELDAIRSAAEKLGIRPVLGVRTKLGLHGAGRWKDSGGDRSKFGLTTREIVDLVEKLESYEMLDCLQLLHFHLGSQITRIRTIKTAMSEATRTLTGLVEMGAPIKWFDVGGGLGIDYDGSSTDYESSVNYSLQEYANDIVFHLGEACAEAKISQPHILSESGRALTAHHAVLVTEVLGVTDFTSVDSPPTATDDDPETIRNFEDVCARVSDDNVQESYHDAVELREEAMTLFRVGQLGLRERARVEEFFWRTCEKILHFTRDREYVPEDLANLERDMADTYFLNFSVFQSMPDAWAIDQLFPIVPLHRHTEEPKRRGIIADITCDSDGKIDRFISLPGPKRTLELHGVSEGERYYVGFFLIGAYQEILGDMHNLFGDTHVVHVATNADGRPRLTHFVPGDKVEEVLSYVQYFRADVTAALRRRIELAIDEDRIGYEDSARLLKQLEAGLNSYTYLLTPENLEGERKS